MQAWLDNLHAYAGWMLLFSLLSFVIGLISTPFLVARIPVDYFSSRSRHTGPEDSRHASVRWLLSGVKNLLGAVLVIAGLIMLVTPGQGLLTILFGLMIMDYPGKYQLECRIIRQPVIFRAVNALREKLNQPPLQAPPE